MLAGLARAVGNGGHLTVLWFLDQAPSTQWAQSFQRVADGVAAGGRGEVTLVAPLIPSVMGTDTHADSIRPQGG